MLKKSLFVAMFTAGAIAFAGLAAAQQNPPVAPSPVKRTIISKMEVPGSNYEVITALLEIAPGFKAGRHFHPGVVDFQVSTASSGSRSTGSRKSLSRRARATKCR